MDIIKKRVVRKTSTECQISAKKFTPNYIVIFVRKASPVFCKEFLSMTVVEITNISKGIQSMKELFPKKFSWGKLKREISRQKIYDFIKRIFLCVTPERFRFIDR